MAKRYKVVSDPDVYFPDGQELKMATAIYEDKPRAIRSLIEEGIDLNHISKGGMTYLYYAMLNKNYDVMELLLKHGADPNIHSKFYTNPAYPKKGYGDDKHIGACLAYLSTAKQNVLFLKNEMCIFKEKRNVSSGHSFSLSQTLLKSCLRSV